MVAMSYVKMAAKTIKQMGHAPCGGEEGKGGGGGAGRGGGVREELAVGGEVRPTQVH